MGRASVPGRSGIIRLRRLDVVNVAVLCKEVEWWDAKAKQVQDKADQGVPETLSGFLRPSRSCAIVILLWLWAEFVLRRLRWNVMLGLHIVVKVCREQ